MKALALIDDLWHPGGIVREGLAGLGDFDWLDDGRGWSAALMAQYHLVVLAKANHVNAAHSGLWADGTTGEVFAEHVRRGGALLILHAGASGFRRVPAMQTLVAGSFEHHPHECPLTLVPEPGHLMCFGCKEFSVFDEQYFMSVEDPAVDVFLHSRSQHGLQPAGWTRTWGAGRICVLTPGHNLEVWIHPGFQCLLRNALAWVSGG